MLGRAKAVVRIEKEKHDDHRRRRPEGIVVDLYSGFESRRSARARNCDQRMAPGESGTDTSRKDACLLVRLWYLTIWMLT